MKAIQPWISASILLWFISADVFSFFFFFPLQDFGYAISDHIADHHPFSLPHIFLWDFFSFSPYVLTLVYTTLLFHLACMFSNGMANPNF